jgi:hypothetical protein
MWRQLIVVFSLFVVPAVVLINPLSAQTDQANPKEVEHMKAGHQKVEGVVSAVKSGLYTVKTSTGATLTLTESAAARYGRTLPKVGDVMTLWLNEGNMVMDARLKGGQPGKASH